MHHPQQLGIAAAVGATCGIIRGSADAFVIPRGPDVPHPRRRAALHSPPVQRSATTWNLFVRVPWATKDENDATLAAAEGARQQPPRAARHEANNNGQSATTNGGVGGDVNSGGAMGDLSKFLLRDDGVDEAWELVDMDEARTGAEAEGGLSSGAVLGMGVAAVGAAALVAAGFGIVPGDVSLPSASEAASAVQRFFADPSASLESVVRTVESMGPSGPLYFGIIYTVAEILAIPAIPLTASAGYLFGLTQGTAVVLTSASVAAAVSFIIGRTLLRSYVESLLEEYPKFQKIDRAIGREGFKLMLLLRLSPVFPFALSNYLYGATSIGFWPYFFGTMVGFTPGTIAYVYTGEIGKVLTLDSASAEPWYVYVGGLTFLGGFLKIVADVATGIIDDLEEEGEES